MSDDKTEEPTPRRLRKAQEDGDSGASAYLAQSVGLIAFSALVPSAALALFVWGQEHLLSALQPNAQVPSAQALVGDVFTLALPILLAVALAASITSKLQAGGSFSAKALTPHFEKLNPLPGLQNLFSTTRLFSVGRSLAVAAAVTYFAWLSLRDHLHPLARSFGHASAAASWAGAQARSILIRSSMLGLFAGLVDFLVVRAAWKKRLRMSRSEVKREHREQEGDPQQKAARERAHHELLASVAIANVRKATVLVVNPTHIACALRYDESDCGEAPLVLANGSGELAKRLIEEAHRYGIPVVRDVPLARALLELEVGEEIPEALYEGVAAILHEAWKMAEEDPTR